MSETTEIPVTENNPYAHLAGSWVSDTHDLYTMHGVTVTFSDDINDTEKILWLGYLQTSLELLPKHIIDKISGLLVSFNSGDTCIEDNYLGCFTQHNFSIFVSVSKQTRERSNIRTILHEIGHAVDYRLDPSGPFLPESIHKNRHRPSSYAGTNAYEDFAESFAVYILSPVYMKKNFKVRYDFMKEKVFLEK
ncbi:MAG: hypothetical protein WDZ40_01920 [Candidatus Spechtbacterales bacterium]